MPVTLTDNGDGTHTANYAPEGPGDYEVEVKYGGKDVPKTPIQITAIPNVDVSKIKVNDLQDSKQ